MTKELIATDAEHSDIMGGSTAAQRIHCPGSYALQQLVPKSETASEFAEEGTALHEAIEYCLLELDSNPDPLLGMVFNKITITQELIDEKLRPALEAFQQLIRENGGDCDYLVEVRGDLKQAEMPGCFGTIDIFGRLANGKLLDLDWKFGDGIQVSPKGNYQLGFYTGCALYTSGDSDLNEIIGSELDQDIIFAIVQPIRGQEGSCIDTWETTTDWVEDFLDEAKKAYDIAIDFNEKVQAASNETERRAVINSPDAPLKTGEHCRFCRAKIICPLKQKMVGEVENVKHSVAEMDPVTMATWLNKADEIESFIKDLRKHAHAEVEAGVKVPGYILKPKRASRVYSDPVAAETVLKRHLKVEGAFVKKLITPAQAEKKLGKKKYEKVLANYVSSVSSGYNLVKGKDDSKQAVTDHGDPMARLGAMTAAAKK